MSAPPATPPGKGPGGLDLSALAAQGAAETDKRITGQQSILDAYLNQVLGESKAGIGAASERDQRRHQFRRSQQLVGEQLNNRRMTQESTLQKARLEAQADDAMSQREWQDSQSAQERAFELGQAAVQRAEQAALQAEDRRRWEAEFGLKEQALSAEDGGDPTTMNPRQASQVFGQKYVGADRGQYLNTRPVADQIRARQFTEESGGGGFRVPGTDFRLGGSSPKTETRGFQDLMDEAAVIARDEMAKGTPNPLALRDKLVELFGSETAASLALFELGDLAAFPTA